MLKDTYLHWRALGYTAARALGRARSDIAAGESHSRPYNAPTGRPWPAVTWQERSPDGTPRERAEHWAAVLEKPERLGLRYVGRAAPTGAIWDKRESMGWYTEPDGDVSRDGSGLCYGVVYQLPARNGRARFVAGYQFGGMDCGPMIDFGTVYESDSGEDFYNPRGHDGAVEAARAANEHARVAAEHEQEYQTAWRAGNEWSDKGDEIATLRRAILDDCRTRREVKADLIMAGIPLTSPTWSRTCAIFRQRIEEALSDIAELRAARRLLAMGDEPQLMFYPDERLKSAFCDGAGLQAFPRV